LGLTRIFGFIIACLPQFLLELNGVLLSAVWQTVLDYYYIAAAALCGTVLQQTVLDYYYIAAAALCWVTKILCCCSALHCAGPHFDALPLLQLEVWR
jgi:hypothetical protein